MTPSLWLEAEKIITQGKIAVLPTDTIYGLVASINFPEAISKINKLKNRDNKPYIILINSLADLDLFKIKLNESQINVLNKLWPGPFSIAFDAKYSFRWPNKKELVNLIKNTGPIIATSCNHKDKPPATTIKDAFNYFGQEVDLYVPHPLEPLTAIPSTVISLDKTGHITIHRQGSGQIPINLKKL
ncbi:MAG: L-threonylcarbamoyladenylate synthase [Candidatus Paceibacterota bacterium]